MATNNYDIDIKVKGHSVHDIKIIFNGALYKGGDIVRLANKLNESVTYVVTQLVKFGDRSVFNYVDNNWFLF